jgi:hypothetical protein
MREEEALIALIFEAIYPGAIMRHNAVQAHGEWDFDLVFEGGGREAVEVTMSTDRERHEIFAAILERPGSFINRVVSQHDWYVVPSQGANVRRIRRDVDRYLAEVERCDVEAFFDGIARNPTPVQRLCTDLRIEHATRCDWNPPGRIGLGLPGRGGQLSGEHVVLDVEAEASKRDNRTKLGRAAAGAGHLAVVLGPHNGLARTSMLEGFFPERAAALPPEVTVAWVTARLYGDSDQYVVWRNISGGTWEAIATQTITDADITARAG